MTLVLKSRVASDGAFCISFTNVYFHGNFGHCLGCESCPLGAMCLPQVGYGAYPTWASVLPIS